jgi:hypothetical protein
MNVLFINTLYQPTFDEWLRLENIQREISGWRAELAREWQFKKFTPGEMYISKKRFHEGVRSHWKVYAGFKCEKSTNLLEYSKDLA